MALGDYGIVVSPNTVARLLHQMGYSLRVNRKQIPTGSSPDRNRQFLYISDLRGRFKRRGQPIVSIDTKKRELVGNFRTPANAGVFHHFRSAITTFARTPLAWPFHTASTTFAPIAAASPLAFLTIPRLLRFRHWLVGGGTKAPHAIAAADNCFCWATPAAAMDIGTALGRRNSNHRSPTHSD